MKNSTSTSFIHFIVDLFKSGNAIALSCGLLAGLCCGFYLPLISFWMHDIGYSGNEIGINTSSLALLIFGAMIPRWMAKLGGYKTLIISIVSTMLVLIVMPFFEELLMIYLMRFIWGLAFGVFWIASETWVNANVNPEKRGFYISLYASLYGLGVFLGPQFLKLTGTEGIMPFIKGLILFLPVLIAIIFMKDKIPAFETAKKTDIKGSLFSQLPLAFLGVMLSGACEISFTNLFAVYGMAENLSDPQILTFLSVFALGNLLYQMPIGWLSDRIDIHKVILFNACVLATCLLLIPFFIHTILIYLLLFLCGGAIVGFYTLSLTLLGHGFSKKDLSRANMLFIVCFTIGGLFGPFISGYLVDYSSHFYMYFMASLVILYAVSVLMPKFRRAFIK